MTTIYCIVIGPGEHIEFLDLAEAEEYRGKHHPNSTIETIDRDLTTRPTEADL